MKRLLAIIVALASVFALCSCSKTSVNKNAAVTLKFVYADENINITLTDEEAANVTSILDGKRYMPLSSGIPSCGFNQNISLKVGNRVFAIACDTCNTIQDLGNLRFFSISEEDNAYIRGLFEKYGGYFPCV